RVPRLARRKTRHVDFGGRVAARECDRRRRVRDETLRGARLHAALAVRASQTELVQPADVREERFVRRNPGKAHLRIVDLLEVRTERAVLVRANGRGEEETVVDAGLLLHIEAE